MMPGAEVIENGSALLAAAHWLEGLVQGPAATTLAVLAVGVTGLMMLSGRLAVRRGLVVTLGCFILFGAPAIARGIFDSAAGMGQDENMAPQPTARPVREFQPPSPTASPAINDPYAGASVAR